jgi:hypothetical protein
MGASRPLFALRYSAANGTIKETTLTLRPGDSREEKTGHPDFWG